MSYLIRRLLAVFPVMLFVVLFVFFLLRLAPGDTAAIIAGLIPTSLGLGIGGAGRAAIALVVVGGQSLCLFLTLLLIPVAYVKFAGLEETVVNRRWKHFISQFRPSRWIRPATVE